MPSSSPTSPAAAGTVGAARQRVEGAATPSRLTPPPTGGSTLDALLAALGRAEPDLRERLVEGDAQPPVAVEEEEQAEHDQGRA